MSQVKLQLEAGNVTPGAPLGPALGGKQLNIRDVATQINALTQNKKGQLVRVLIQIDDKTKQYKIQVKGTPTSQLLKKASKIEKGSSIPNRRKVASLSTEQIKKIAAEKQADLNAFTPQAAFHILAGTARSMGITITN